ncbi:MAG: hypothetical protein J6B54_04915 [Clostridia bacterium]|nr:hypothetical protein [Clostridia bacterium]
MELNQSNPLETEGLEEQILVFRRPDPKDETDRIGKEIVRRMIEAGVVEPK